MSSRLPFTKMQAVGNDFVVIEEVAWGKDTDWESAAIALCDRHNGVGGDGLLVVCPSEVADTRMRMFNPDGTEDMCGNGLRCVVRWAAERGHFDAIREGDDSLYDRGGSVETLVGVRHVFLHGTSDAENIETNMGTPLFCPDELPALVPNHAELIAYPLKVEGYGTLIVSTVNTGSTHTVIWVEELPEDELFFAISPKVEHHALYPERTSVLWAKQNSHTSNTFDIRIWERGVGETLGCGTGACAVAVLAAKQGKTERSDIAITNTYVSTIRSRGGVLKVVYNDSYHKEKEPDGAMVLIGTAHTVYSGAIARSV